MVNKEEDVGAPEEIWLVGDSEEHWDPMDDQQGDLVGDLVGDSEEHLDLADDWQGDLVDAMEI